MNGGFLSDQLVGFHIYKIHPDKSHLLRHGKELPQIHPNFIKYYF